jgi:hypothetical protein
MLTRRELVERFQDVCAGLAIALAPRPLVAWSPAEVQLLWLIACRVAGVDELVATVLLNRVDPWPACFPADSRLLLCACVSDYRALVARFGTNRLVG